MNVGYIVCTVLLIVAAALFSTTRKTYTKTTVSASGGSIAVGGDANGPIIMTHNPKNIPVSATAPAKKPPFDWPKFISSILTIVAGVIGVLTKLGYV